MAKKSVNSDIYNLSQLVDDVKKTFIPNETDETLAIGTYGYIGALESHRLQTQVQMTGELCNESFPSRARLERNVITHAIMANIEDIKTWDCTVTCAEKSSDNAYVISYSEEEIVSTKGVLTLENRNDFDIIVHLFADGKERVEEMPANGVTVLYQISKDTVYTLGCHADVSEGIEIKLYVYDGEGNTIHLD